MEAQTHETARILRRCGGDACVCGHGAPLGWGLFAGTEADWAWTPHEALRTRLKNHCVHRRGS